MSRYFAIIREGKVDNVIVAEDWTEGVDITSVSPRPAKGWLYEAGVFSPPPPPSPVQITEIERADLLARMTPVELHGWYRAAQRAMSTNSPAAADRNALYAWLRWESMRGTMDLTSQDVVGLGQVWIALGMSEARATELLTPLVQD